MDADNRLRQLGAWLLHENPEAESAESLAWLIEQPANTYFRAVLFRAVNLPTYGKDQWFLLGWREKSPTWPRLIEPLFQVGLEQGTVDRLIAGEVIRLEARWVGEAWDLN